MEICVKRFQELTNRELYNILKLRVDVFVVEQNCPYPEIDGRDIDAIHVFIPDGEEILAYLRVMDRGVMNEAPSIGRVIARKRRCGYGTAVLREGIRQAEAEFHADKIYLEAQLYARKFYENQGFRQISDPFLEDGIPHIAMLRNSEA